MSKKRARYAINVDSGVVVFRSESTDALPTIWKLIDDETAEAIVEKKVSATAVIEAIQKSIVRGEDFNWKEYDMRRKKDRDLFNVSEHNMIPDGDSDPNEEEKTEQEDGEVVSLKELGFGGKGGEASKSGKTSKTSKPNSEQKGEQKSGEGADDVVQY